MKHSPLDARKKPRQSRSAALVEALLGGAARVLSRRTVSEATTNAIAQEAGVSIGSLYQYFPNKTAIVAALIRARAASDVQNLKERINALEARPLPELIRGVVQAVLAQHRRDHRLYRVLLKEVPQLGQTETVRALMRQMREHMAELLSQRSTELRDIDPELAAFILSVVGESLTHAAILERPELLESTEFENSLVDLAVRFLCPTFDGAVT